MERRKEISAMLNEGLHDILFRWKSNPDSDRTIEMVTAVINQVSEDGFGISLKINDEIMQLTESRRAITWYDIQRLAKHEDHNFVFNLGPKKEGKGEYRLLATKVYGQPHLVLVGRHDGMVGIFRPHEITSIEAL